MREVRRGRGRSGRGGEESARLPRVVPEGVKKGIFWTVLAALLVAAVTFIVTQERPRTFDSSGGSASPALSLADVPGIASDYVATAAPTIDGATIASAEVQLHIDADLLAVTGPCGTATMTTGLTADRLLVSDYRPPTTPCPDGQAQLLSNWLELHLSAQPTVSLSGPTLTLTWAAAQPGEQAQTLEFQQVGTTPGPGEPSDGPTSTQ